LSEVEMEHQDAMNHPDLPVPGATKPPGPPRRGPLQRFRRIGVAVALVVLVGGFGAELVAGLLSPRLAPPEAVDQIWTDRDVEALAELRRRFPRDPRVLFLSAYGARDRAESEKHLRAALDEESTLRRDFPDGKLEAHIRSLLARLLQVRGEEDEARVILRPSCGAQLGEIAAGAGLTEEWVTAACRPEHGG
jgi:hypothetical protein